MHETAAQPVRPEAHEPPQGPGTRQGPGAAAGAAPAAPATPAREPDAQRERVAELETQLADQKSMYEVAMARNAAIWEMVDEQLREAALQVERARGDQAAAAAAVDAATRRTAELEARVAAAVEARQELEQAIAATARTHEETEARHATDLAEAAARAGELESALRRAHEARDARAADVQRLISREAELTGRIDEREAARAALERQLGATRAAVQDADARATRERLAASRKAAEREAELDGRLRQEQEARAALEHEAGQIARLRERLARAERMEAVGRLVSEAASTCGNLLADVHRNVQQWITTANGDPVARQRGEAVLDDVTRAAGIVRQLTGYADEGRASTSTDLGTIVRDLEPVLGRVAGQDVRIALPDVVPPLDVDVAGERVERLLVSLVSYGRERLPDGGRVSIELGAVVVDAEFTSRHPNARPGPHALITLTRSGGTVDDGARNGRPGGIVGRFRGRPGRTPGLDLGTLQNLVGECGGHLWMTVEPQGDIVAKLHLPLVAGSVQVQ